MTTGLNKRGRLLEKYKELYEEIHHLLVGKPDCYSFIEYYGQYVECIDDLVDEPKNIELIDKTSFLSTKLFSSNYWIANRDQLLLVEQLIHIIYFNSVTWERAEEVWKRRDAKALSHCAYYMLFAILLLETKDSILVQRISIKFMEKAHLEHIEDLTYEEAEA